MSSRLRIRSFVLPLAALSLLAAQVTSPSPVWKGLLTAFGGLWLLTYLWARSLQKHLRLERLMRYGWAQVGDRLEEQFVLQNEGAIPATWVEISDQSTLPGYSVARATGVDGHSQNAWTTSGTCERRGEYSLGHTQLLTGDPLGIYQVEITQPEEAMLSVMPPIIPLPFIDAAAGGWQGEGRPRSHTAEQSVNAESVRPYAPGDSLRLIHWPTTARREAPYVRVLQGAPAGDWWIALDLDRRVQVGESAAESTVELGVIVAASLLDHALGLQRPVGLVATGEPPEWIKPEPGEHQRWKVMKALARVNPGETGLATLLERMGPGLHHQASVLVVTPSTGGDWLAPLARLIGQGIRATAVLIDPGTFGASSSVEGIGRFLEQAGVPYYVVGRDLLHRPEARPGPAGQWEWQVLATGKALPVRRPADLTWRRLQ